MYQRTVNQLYIEIPLCGLVSGHIINVMVKEVTNDKVVLSLKSMTKRSWDSLDFGGSVVGLPQG